MPLMYLPFAESLPAATESGNVCLSYLAATAIGGAISAAGVALWRRNVALTDYMRTDLLNKDKRIDELLNHIEEHGLRVK